MKQTNGFPIPSLALFIGLLAGEIVLLFDSGKDPRLLRDDRIAGTRHDSPLQSVVHKSRSYLRFRGS